MLLLGTRVEQIEKKLNTADSYNEIRHKLPSETREYSNRIA